MADYIYNSLQAKSETQQSARKERQGNWKAEISSEWRPTKGHEKEKDLD